MENIMSKTNDTPNFSHGTKDHGILADSELDAVTGGMLGLTAASNKPNPGKMSWEHYFDRSSVVIVP
jgi:hypothetical protein